MPKSHDMAETEAHKCRSGGIWVESKDFQEWALQNTNVRITPKTAVLFLPFQQIVHVLASVDVPYVSERVLK
jgi:hypothetical protein